MEHNQGGLLPIFFLGLKLIQLQVNPLVKLNCDLGEGAGSEAAVMPFIDQANIACGVHAGSSDLMLEALILAKAHGVSVGAHPGYADREGFGRRSMHCDFDEIVERVETALKHIDPARVTLNPDCGFAPGSAADVSLDEVYTKLCHEVEAARRLRDRHG